MEFYTLIASINAMTIHESDLHQFVPICSTCGVCMYMVYICLQNWVFLRVKTWINIPALDSDCILHTIYSDAKKNTNQSIQTILFSIKRSLVACCKFSSLVNHIILPHVPICLAAKFTKNISVTLTSLDSTSFIMHSMIHMAYTLRIAMHVLCMYVYTWINYSDLTVTSVKIMAGTGMVTWLYVIYPHYIYIFIWLVVWNIFYFPIYWVANHPNWLIFFRGVQTTNQSWYVLAPVGTKALCSGVLLFSWPLQACGPIWRTGDAGYPTRPGASHGTKKHGTITPSHA